MMSTGFSAHIWKTTLQMYVGVNMLEIMNRKIDHCVRLSTCQSKKKETIFTMSLHFQMCILTQANVIEVSSSR